MYLTPASRTDTRIVGGFIAGMLATLSFHQFSLMLLHAIGIAPFMAWSVQAVPPLGLPAVLSLAFWGGVWGMLFGVLHPAFLRGAGYWLNTFVFGGILATAVALLVVLPLKGGPWAAGWNARVWITAMLINGAWGIGTGVFLRSFLAWRTPAPHPAN